MTNGTEQERMAGEAAGAWGARRLWILTGVAVLAIAGLAGALIWWQLTSQRVYVDSASIEAPQIDLSPASAGTLEDTYVNPGDAVDANETVARVGDELIDAKVAGIIVSINQKTGAEITPGESVVSMVDPAQLRVVGKVDEDKGLSRIAVGDPVVFTVDAFGGREFSAVVDEIAPTANAAGIVFNISGQRQTQQFDVKARFDISAYPQLRNGMSARMWIYAP